MERSIVLIDGENIVKSWQTYCRKRGLADKVDYQKLIKKLSEGTDLLRAHFYDGVPELIPLKKKNFLTALQHQGIEVKTRILKERKHECTNCHHIDQRFVQKGVDVSLATDILRHAWQGTCGICIVVSGDEDYKDAIQCAKDKGIKMWVASFKDSLSKELRIADKILYLDDIFDDIKK